MHAADGRCNGRSCRFVTISRNAAGTDWYVASTVDTGTECLLCLFSVPDVAVVARQCPFVNVAVEDMSNSQKRNVLHWCVATNVACVRACACECACMRACMCVRRNRALNDNA